MTEYFGMTCHQCIAGDDGVSIDQCVFIDPAVAELREVVWGFNPSAEVAFMDLMQGHVHSRLDTVQLSAEPFNGIVHHQFIAGFHG